MKLTPFLLLFSLTLSGQGRGHQEASRPPRPTVTHESRPRLHQEAPRPHYRSGAGPHPVGPRLGIDRHYDRPRVHITISPRPLPRVFTIPDHHIWQKRDIMAEIRWMARRGSIPVRYVADQFDQVIGNASFPAGWCAFGFRIPPQGTLNLVLNHPNRPWFRLIAVDKWGDRLPPQMLTLEPWTLSFTNTSSFKIKMLYVIVDDPGWMSYETNPFILKISKSWATTPKEWADTGIWSG